MRSGSSFHDRSEDWTRHFGSWRLRLLVLVLLAILPCTLLTAWEQHRTAEARLADAGEDLAALALNTAREQAALVGRAETFLAALAELPVVREGTPAECQPVLAGFGGSASWRHTLGVYAPDGQPVCTDQPGPTPGVGVLDPGVVDPGVVDPGLAEQAWFRAAVAGGRFVLSDLVIGRLMPLPMVMAVQPIFGPDGAVRRLVVAGIDIARLGGQTLPQVPAGAEVMLLVDAAGTVVARYPAAPGLVGRSVHGTGLAQAMRGEVGNARGSGLLGGDRLFGFAPIPETRAVLVVGRDSAGILASVSALQRQVLLLAGSAALVALLLALAAGHWMVLRPMAGFAEAVRQIARGNLGARVETGRLDGELGALAREINGMAHRLAEHQAALEAKHREMAQLAAALGAARDTAEAASAAKTRFVGMLSHELRTPLNGIFGHAQLLGADPSLSPMQRRCAEQITASGEHLMSMIRELLDLAAIEAGKVSLAPAPVRLAGVVEACAALMRPVASGKGLSFGVELAPGAAAWVAADALRLRQVLLNLLGNAVKFTFRGEVVLRIQPTADGLTRFEVSDTGPGLDAAERAAMFQEFMRLPGAAQSEGSGLGLAITARLVALMGGTIGVESDPGCGSLFWVELPLPPVPAGKDTEAGPRSILPLGQPLRLLLADDVMVNREVARALLNGAGHAVELVGDGAQAVDAALAADWDAVLLDVHMPVMDGLAAARRIRAAGGRRGRVPILAVTASATPAEVAACLAAGMDAHVEKPLRAWELQNALAAILTRTLPAVAAE